MFLASRGTYNATVALCFNIKKKSVEISMYLYIRYEVSTALNVHSVFV